MLEDEADQRGIAVTGNELSDALQVLIDQRYLRGWPPAPIGFNEVWRPLALVDSGTPARGLEPVVLEFAIDFSGGGAGHGPGGEGPRK